MSEYSKAFSECIAQMVDEVQLAKSWQRPSLLLAIHSSMTGQQKAQDALESRLFDLSVTVIHVGRDGTPADLFQAIEKFGTDSSHVYFVEGLGRDKDNFRKLNLQREALVDEAVAAVFWLTPDEAAELPRLAPDFWSFRHRVIEFAPARGSRNKIVPSGLLLWHPEYFQSEPLVVEERIAYQRTVLQQLPATPEASMLRIEALELLANQSWLVGDLEQSMQLLQQALILQDPIDVAAVRANINNGIAVIAFEQGELQDGLQTLSRAVEFAPGFGHLRINLGIVQYAAGHSAQAVKSIEQAIKMNAASADFRYTLGFIYLLMGQLEMAYPCFEKALELDATHVRAQCAMAAYYSLTELRVPERIAKLFDSEDWHRNAYGSICRTALLGDKNSALQQLRSAVIDRRILPHFVECDPGLHLLFDRMTLKSTL